MLLCCVRIFYRIALALNRFIKLLLPKKFYDIAFGKLRILIIEYRDARHKKQELESLTFSKKINNSQDFYSLYNWDNEINIPFNPPPLVSIIVPNFNHAAYLRERLDSIYNQTYSNYEVLLLDDCSTDDSQAILMEYANKYRDKTITVFNKENSGKVFEQWKSLKQTF